MCLAFKRVPAATTITTTTTTTTYTNTITTASTKSIDTSSTMYSSTSASTAHLSVSPTTLSAATYLFDSNNNHRTTAVSPSQSNMRRGVSSPTPSRKRPQLVETPRSTKTRRMDEYDASEGGYRTQGTQWSAGPCKTSSSPSSQVQRHKTSSPPPLTQAQLNAYKLRTRLKIALYKVQTNQTKKPLACLKVFAASPGSVKDNAIVPYSGYDSRSSSVSISTPKLTPTSPPKESLNLPVELEKDPLDGQGKSTSLQESEKVTAATGKQISTVTHRHLLSPSSPQASDKIASPLKLAEGAKTPSPVKSTGLGSPPPSCKRDATQQNTGTQQDSPTRPGKDVPSDSGNDLGGLVPEA